MRPVMVLLITGFIIAKRHVNQASASVMLNRNQTLTSIFITS